MTQKVNKNTPRKRGAQLGNLNAFKHGLYAKPSHDTGNHKDRPAPAPPQSPATLADFSGLNTTAEARMIRVMLARHLEMRAAHPSTTPEETLTDLRVISFAVARFASLIRLQRNFQSEKDACYSENWMEEMLAKIDADSKDPDSPDGIIEDL